MRRRPYAEQTPPQIDAGIKEGKEKKKNEKRKGDREGVQSSKGVAIKCTMLTLLLGHVAACIPGCNTSTRDANNLRITADISKDFFGLFLSKCSLVRFYIFYSFPFVLSISHIPVGFILSHVRRY